MSRSPDKRAVQILSSTYWSSTGWKKIYNTPAEDFAYAKAVGVMFDAIRIGHDDEVAWALRSRSRLTKSKVVDGFLASLTTRRLDWRSALGSYAASLHFPAHSFLKRTNSFGCSICGEFDSLEKPADLNVLNFERFKWGGVRHTNPLYIAFDLEQFFSELPMASTPDDFALIKNVLDIARSCSNAAKLADLVKNLARIFPSNVQERRVLIGILGYCGILQDPSKPGFLNDFPFFSERPETPWYKDDWPYPVQWWNGSCGVSEEAVKFWFPNL